MPRRLILIVCALALWALVGCVDPERADQPGTLATVAGAPITVERVRALMTFRDGDPPVWVAGAVNPDPAQAALDRAIRDELLALESQRRGLDGGTRAAQIEALIDEERNTTAGLDADAISDAEAQAWYQDNRAIFDEPHEADVAWAELADGDTAHGLLNRADGTDQATFLKLVDENGAADSGTATIDHDGTGAVDMVARAAFAAAAPAGVGLAEDKAERRWWLVRVERITFEPSTWDAALAYRVKSALAWEREQDHLTELVDALRGRWPVRVHSDWLTELSDATGGAY